MTKLKVIHVVYIFELGGIESFIIQLCNNMDFDKYDNYVVTLIDEKLGQIHLFNPNVKVHSLNFKQGEIHTISGFFKTLNSLTKLINDIKPDVIHSHHEHYVGLFVQLASKLSKQKVVNVRTVHSGGSFYSKQVSLSDFIKLWIEKITFRFFSVNLVAVSQGVYDNNAKHFGNIAASNTLIYNGVDLTKFDKNRYDNTLREKFGLHEDDIVYVYVARLNPGKNHEFLINIWQEILNETPKGVLVFAGDGPLKEELLNMTRDFNLNNSIKFLGSIDNVPELLSISNVGVFPSLFEGMSISLLEKFAMKLPVVASDIKAFSDVANNNVDSYLIPLNKKQEFIDILVELSRDSNLRCVIGANAFKTAEKYSLTRMISAYSDFYSTKAGPK